MKWHPIKVETGHPRIALLTHFPTAGRVRTDLIPTFGDEGDTALHHDLTKRVASEVMAIAATREADVEVWHDGGTRIQMRSWLGRLPVYRRQPGGDLGRRLFAVFETAFREGARRCVAIGSDYPAVTAKHMREAMEALKRDDVVFGPAINGGYWLIGINSDATGVLPALFDRIEWGSDHVLQQSLERVRQNGLSVSLLEELGNVDLPEDLYEWKQKCDPPPEATRISVVIPTLNEQAMITDAISSAYNSGMAEVIVADGGSTDETRKIATDMGARVVESARGRARQMNSGAAQATGDALLFLHADTTLPPRAAFLVQHALASPGVVGGAFTYSAYGAGKWDTIITTGGRWRSQLSGHPYGDQGLFLRTRTFNALSGFPDIPVMEDWELVYRLRKLGQVVVLPEPIITSSASFAEHGFARASLLNLVAIFGYQLGIAPCHLVVWRNRIARRAG